MHDDILPLVPILKSWKLKRNVIITPKTKNGANGISLFIPWFLEKAISARPIIAPDQKEITNPESAAESPNNQPRLIAIFASPRPIHFPFETNHKKANGKAMIGPDKNSRIDGMCS